MQNPAKLSSPALTGVYTTAHAIDRAYGLAAFLAFRIAERTGTDFASALRLLPLELDTVRFHEYGDDMEEYEQENCLDFDVIERYNRPIVQGGVSYKLPSATAAEFWRRGWVLSAGKNATALAPSEDGDVQKGVMRILDCLTANNGYASKDLGAYLRDKLPRAFAWVARLANDVADGRSEKDRFDFWHRELIQTARAGFLALADGVVFPGEGSEDAEGLVPYLESFRKAFPEIAAKLKLDESHLAKVESIFTLHGYLVALHAIGESETVEAKYALWRDAFHLGERVLYRRKELAREFVVNIDAKNVFALPHVPEGVGLYLETDETIAKELWRFMRTPDHGRSWSPLQETFCDLLGSFMSDVVEGEKLDPAAKTVRAKKETLRTASKENYRSVCDFVLDHVEDELVSESLVRLVALSTLRPAIMVVRKSVGHYVILTNGHLGMKIDLRKVVDRLDELEPRIWHGEGREISDRFEFHMVMSGSTMIRDNRPSKLEPEELKRELGRLVGVI